MSQSAPAGGKAISPQATGFSQMQARSLGGGEGGSMSVLLSWHEKVRSAPRTSVDVADLIFLGCRDCWTRFYHASSDRQENCLIKQCPHPLLLFGRHD